jgi:hypothetical protein
LFKQYGGGYHVDVTAFDAHPLALATGSTVP